MNNKSNVLVIENDAVVGHSFDRVLSGKGYEVSTMLNGEEAVNDEGMNASLHKEAAKAAGMFVAAPFIALAYVIALPFIGNYLFAKLAAEAYVKSHPAITGKLKKAKAFARNIGLFFAAPFIALAYVTTFPFVGLYLLAKLAMEAHEINGVRIK